MTNPDDSLAVIVVAAGSSTRMNGIDKLWHPINGISVLERSVRAAAVHASELIIVVRPDDRERAEELAGRVAAPVRVCVVIGGSRRQDSVRHGLQAVRTAGWVAVHDGARPLASPGLFARVWKSARESGPAGAAIPALEPTDTMKIVEGGSVKATIGRSTVRAVQTPQIFSAQPLRDAYRVSPADIEVTDDSSVLEQAGTRVSTVPGEAANIKITTADDLAYVEWLISKSAPPGGSA